MEKIKNLAKAYGFIVPIMILSLAFAVPSLSRAIDFEEKVSEEDAIEESTVQFSQLSNNDTLSLLKGGVAVILDYEYDYDDIIVEDTAEEVEEAVYESTPKHSMWVYNSRLYIRTSPDNTSEDNIFDVLNPGQEVFITGLIGDWCEIEYEEGKYYIMGKYLSDRNPYVVNKKLEEYKEKWDGVTKLTKNSGRINGPSGSETYYNLDMKLIVARLQRHGYEGEYWVREDGCKMFGDYIMVAANFELRPLGTIVETSLGYGIVCDTGGFVEWNPTGIDIAVTW